MRAERQMLSPSGAPIDAHAAVGVAARSKLDDCDVNCQGPPVGKSHLARTLDVSNIDRTRCAAAWWARPATTFGPGFCRPSIQWVVGTVYDRCASSRGLGAMTEYGPQAVGRDRPLTGRL